MDGKGKQSLYLIVLLLAALFLGPAVVLLQDRHDHPRQRLVPLVLPERIVDAPAPLPSSEIP